MRFLSRIYTQRESAKNSNMQIVSIPRVVGHTQKGDAAEHIRIVSESRKPLDPENHDIQQNLIQVQRRDLELVRQLYEQVPMAKIGMAFNINSLEHGGLTIQFGKANPATYKTADLAGRGLLHFLTQVQLNWSLYGFAVVTTLPCPPDTQRLYNPVEDTAKDFVHFAQVVPMEKIDVCFTVSPHGEYNWIVYDRLHALDPWNPKRRVLPNVLIFVHDQPPHPLTGGLRSGFMSLANSYMSLMTLRRCNEIAEKNKCAPMIVTEHVERPKDVDIATGVIPYMGCDTYEGKGPPDNRTRIGRLNAQLADLQCRCTNKSSLRVHFSSVYRYTDDQLTVLSAHMEMIRQELQGMGDQVCLSNFAFYDTAFC
jgi:hypothetical protein